MSEQILTPDQAEQRGFNKCLVCKHMIDYARAHGCGLVAGDKGHLVAKGETVTVKTLDSFGEE